MLLGDESKEVVLSPSEGIGIEEQVNALLVEYDHIIHKYE